MLPKQINTYSLKGKPPRANILEIFSSTCMA